MMDFVVASSQLQWWWQEPLFFSYPGDGVCPRENVTIWVNFFYLSLRMEAGTPDPLIQVCQPPNHRFTPEEPWISSYHLYSGPLGGNDMFAHSHLPSCAHNIC